MTQAFPQYPSRLVEVNGTRLNLVEAGEGPPVLLIHGFPDTHMVWRKQVPALVEAGYRVIVPDTRGCGDSDEVEPVSGYRLTNLTRDLIELLDVLKLDKVHLVAHDWGAVIGWQLILHYPQRFHRYITLSVGHPNAYAKGGLMQKLRGFYILLFQLRGFAELLLKAGNWWLFRKFTNCQEEWPYWHKSLSRRGRLRAGLNYYRANLSMILPTDYPDVQVPVLGLWSTADRYLVEKQMVDSARYVKDWQYARVDNAHHWLQVDQPENVNRLILQYLNEGNDVEKVSC